MGSMTTPRKPGKLAKNILHDNIDFEVVSSELKAVCETGNIDYSKIPLSWVKLSALIFKNGVTGDNKNINNLLIDNGVSQYEYYKMKSSKLGKYLDNLMKNLAKENINKELNNITKAITREAVNGSAKHCEIALKLVGMIDNDSDSNAQRRSPSIQIIQNYNIKEPTKLESGFIDVQKTE